MTYVMSDLHGCFELFLKMLQRIGFCEDDRLYILGDLCDRGGDSAKLYMNVMARSNVFVVKGNHEDMMEKHLETLLDEVSDEDFNIFDMYDRRELRTWIANGGDMTLMSLYHLNEDYRRRILAYVKALPLYRRVEVGGKTYVLVHGGLGDYREGMTLEEFDPRELLWSQPDFDGTYFDGENTVLVVGHTPTFLLRQTGRVPSIYHGAGNVIAVDCGAVFVGHGCLGCLCLDTGEEFYVR